MVTPYHGSCHERPSIPHGNMGLYMADMGFICSSTFQGSRENQMRESYPWLFFLSVGKVCFDRIIIFLNKNACYTSLIFTL